MPADITMWVILASWASTKKVWSGIRYNSEEAPISLRRWQKYSVHHYRVTTLSTPPRTSCTSISNADMSMNLFYRPYSALESIHLSNAYMDKLIKNGLIIEDRWTIISPGPTVLPSNFYVLPLAQWKHHECAHDSHNKSAGFWLMPDENIDKTAHIDRAKIIAVYFPSLTDGRGFSMGRLLRERYGLAGN